MNQTFLRTASTAFGVLALVVPVVASAHAHGTYKIGNATYNIVIGSLSEPIVVDDKTGLDLTVTKGPLTMSADGDMDNAAAATPVAGLESTLKLEISAGGQTKTFDISPAYGAPGKYTTLFYPTAATTYTYRLKGTINDTPVDLSFSCLPEGTPKAADDHTEKVITDGVTQLSYGGGFGCPTEKAKHGFPEKSASLVDVAGAASSSRTIAFAGLALAAVALALGMRRRS